MSVNLENVWNNIIDLENTIYYIKTLFIVLCTYYTILKLSNNKINLNNILIFLVLCIISYIIVFIKENASIFVSIVFLIFSMSSILSLINGDNIGYYIIFSTLALSLNYIIFAISIVLNFIPNMIFIIKNNLLNLIIMIILHIFILYKVLGINKVKYGITFLKKRNNNEYLDIIILNIGINIVFSVILLSNIDIIISRSLFIAFLISAIIMFITIQKSLQLYYKQKLLIQDLNETKEELEKKNQEIEQLEKENLEFSKKSHSLAHKQRALEYQINQILLKSADSQKTDSNNKTENKQAKLEKITKVKNEINKLSKEMYSKTATVELTKTGIYEIDNILEYMQSECNKNNIDFHLQIIGNIYHMTNKIIEKEDLQILLADHIKNAIIAIKHSDNINKSILVKLGKINDIYSLYIYDSGIEFKKETLLNLGKKPSTTHVEEGGTGMGFMNTFDTLKKYNASLVINEIGKPNKDNYTKILIIKFDNKCEFKLISYRQEEIGEILEKLVDKSTTSDIIVENKS